MLTPGRRSGDERLSREYRRTHLHTFVAGKRIGRSEVRRPKVTALGYTDPVEDDDSDETMAPDDEEAADEQPEPDSRLTPDAPDVS
jgi:hypothetical protein